MLRLRELKMAKTKAGEVHSIRLPSGTAAELKELTGDKVSTRARELLLAFIAQTKLLQQRSAK
jgi:hypothetical protein